MYKAILVDDEILIREAVKENMNWQQLGFNLVGCFANGKEAIAYLRENPVDVVMTDIEMPHMDGLELSRLIYEEYKQTVILILSGYDRFEYARQAMKYKVNEYLLKPFSADELSQVLRRLKSQLDSEREENRRLLQIQQAYKKNRVLLKSKVLMDIICGTRTMEECGDELGIYRIDLAHSWFCAAVFGFSASPDDRMEPDLLSFAVYNIANEILNNYKLGQALQRMDHQVAALLYADNPSETEGRFKRLFERIRDEIRRCVGLEVTIGVGEFVQKERIEASYREARQLLEYEYLWGSSSVFFWSQVSPSFGGGESGSPADDFEDRLREGKPEEIREYLWERADRMRNAYLSREAACVEMQNILDRIRTLMEAMELRDLGTYAAVKALAGGLKNFPSLDEAMEQIGEVSSAAAAEIRALYENRGEKRSVLALDYIKNHYMDPDISLQSVCSYMAMSPSRFSAMFKEYTGGSFMDALIHIRMEKAKELLKNTDLKNYEIAEKVGFKDPHYFSLSFKKATGMTPSEYAREKRG